MIKKIEIKEFENKLTQVPKEVSMFIENLYVDPILEQMVGEDVEDYLVIVNDLADQISYYVLGLLSTQEFKDNLAEVLYLEGVVDIQKAYDAIQKFVLSKLNKKDEAVKENPLEEAKLVESGHISHVDVLKEIENPTPSMSSTVDFKNSPIKTSTSDGKTNKIATTNNATSSTKSTPVATTIQPNPSPHSSAPTNTYVNPALNIATKLDQKLSTPSASIPKDIYVSKKPDPYHEPVV